MDAGRPSDYVTPEKTLDAATQELTDLLSTEDPNDPETHYRVCALQVKRYGLMVAIASRMKDVEKRWMEENKFQETLQDWSKRLAAAAAQRKTRMLPEIIKRLEELQGTSTTIQEHANNAQFWADDE